MSGAALASLNLAAVVAETCVGEPQPRRWARLFENSEGMEDYLKTVGWPGPHSRAVKPHYPCSFLRAERILHTLVNLWGPSKGCGLPCLLPHLCVFVAFTASFEALARIAALPAALWRSPFPCSRLLEPSVEPRSVQFGARWRILRFGVWLLCSSASCPCYRSILRRRKFFLFLFLCGFCSLREWNVCGKEWN